MGRIRIEAIGITEAGTECVVNAANSRLAGGSGVCGAIFDAAGWDEMQAACDAIGHCDTGSAVMTPAFRMDARFVIHAVGPVWQGGQNGEAEKLYSCYRASLDLAARHGCRSIAFPLISSGIYGYPKEEAWKVALRACTDYLNENPDCEMEIVFAAFKEGLAQMGRKELECLTERTGSWS